MTGSPLALVVYGTTYGHTAKVAERVRDVLAELGFQVTLARADELPPELDPAAYDLTVVGASILTGRHQSCVERFVADHRDGLARVPSAFFSVSGSAASPFPETRAEARRLMDAFLDEAGWSPDVRATFGGAVAYTRYSPLVRLVMKRIAKKNRGSTDTTRDHEYTDWAAVESFARTVAALVGRHEPAHRATPEAAPPIGIL